MAKPPKLSEIESGMLLEHLEGWVIDQGKLQKEYVFDDFFAAFSFMTAVALAAQQMDHHPDWFNSYNSVRIELISHDVGGLSTRNFDLAKKITQFATVWQKSRV